MRTLTVWYFPFSKDGRRYDNHPLCGAIYTNNVCKQLYQQSQTATQAQYDRAGNLIQMADEQIVRFQQIIQQIDELQTEWNKLKRIGEIVKAMKERVEELDRRL